MESSGSAQSPNGRRSARSPWSKFPGPFGSRGPESSGRQAYLRQSFPSASLPRERSVGMIRSLRRCHKIRLPVHSKSSSSQVCSPSRETTLYCPL